MWNSELRIALISRRTLCGGSLQNLWNVESSLALQVRGSPQPPKNF
ncbi:MAG: hypothetical protein IJG38_08540 [Thermoguttaceae bacterium]|nr:hypothetical protein [Thermoguttaceae bacterium]